MTLYQALYNDMVYESSAETISIHKTKQGARNALAKHIKQEHENHNKLYDYNVEEMGASFGAFEAWGISEIKVQE